MGAPELKIDIESLRTLRAVVDTGSFTLAADALGMTQSAVSHKVKRLEERVGLDLVVRGAVVTATADGADLLRFADRIVGAHDEAVAHLTRSELEGSLTLGSNVIGDQGAKRLATALACNSTLTTLSLDNNGIGYQGAEQLTTALERNSTLTILNLRGNRSCGPTK